MSVSAGTLALWIGAAFALASAIAAFTARAGDARAWVAGRALAMAAAFSSLASFILLDALRRHDLTIDYVARHSTHGVGLATALLGAFSDPAGAGLVIASMLGIVGAWFARRARAPSIAGTAAVTMVVLLAAPLAGRPLARLPWLPVDGQDALVFFRESASVVYVLALSIAMVSSTLTLGIALERWRGSGAPGADHVAARVTLAAMATAITVRTWVALAAGMARETSPLGMLGGTGGVALLVSLVALVLVVGDRMPGQAAVAGALAALLSALALTLTSPSVSAASVAVRVLSYLSLGVAGVAAWQGRSIIAGILRPVRLRRPAIALGLAAFAVVLIAGVMELTTRARAASLPSGGHVAVSGGALDHLGISRYEDDDSQVLALALEERRGGSTRLSSAEHREYSDTRGAVLGGLVRIPAVMGGVLTTIVWLEQVQAGDDVTLSLIERSPLTWWWFALGLALASVVASFTMRRTMDAAAPAPNEPA